MGSGRVRAAGGRGRGPARSAASAHPTRPVTDRRRVATPLLRAVSHRPTHHRPEAGPGRPPSRRCFHGELSPGSRRRPGVQCCPAHLPAAPPPLPPPAATGTTQHASPSTRHTPPVPAHSAGCRHPVPHLSPGLLCHCSGTSPACRSLRPSVTPPRAPLVVQYPAATDTTNTHTNIHTRTYSYIISRCRVSQLLASRDHGPGPLGPRSTVHGPRVPSPPPARPISRRLAASDQTLQRV